MLRYACVVSCIAGVSTSSRADAQRVRNAQSRKVSGFEVYLAQITLLGSAPRGGELLQRWCIGYQFPSKVTKALFWSKTM